MEGAYQISSKWVITQEMADLQLFLSFGLGLLLGKFKSHLQANYKKTQIQNFTKCLEYYS